MQDLTPASHARPDPGLHARSAGGRPSPNSQSSSSAAAVEPLDGARHASLPKADAPNGRTGWGSERRRACHRGHRRRLARGSVRRGPSASRGGVGTQCASETATCCRSPTHTIAPESRAPARPASETLCARNARREAAGQNAAGETSNTGSGIASHRERRNSFDQHSSAIRGDARPLASAHACKRDHLRQERPTRSGGPKRRRRNFEHGVRHCLESREAQQLRPAFQRDPRRCQTPRVQSCRPSAPGTPRVTPSSGCSPPPAGAPSRDDRRDRWRY